jgi:predicted RNA binding protein YcfA (HicA-like mRNA interferase family)
MTWGEVSRQLKAAGYMQVRSGKGSHELYRHPVTGQELWVAIHTKKDAGQLEGTGFSGRQGFDDDLLSDCD